jgi:hypothetical protein
VAILSLVRFIYWLQMTLPFDFKRIGFVTPIGATINNGLGVLLVTLLNKITKSEELKTN